MIENSCKGLERTDAFLEPFQLVIIYGKAGHLHGLIVSRLECNNVVLSRLSSSTAGTYPCTCYKVTEVLLPLVVASCNQEL